MRCTQPASPGGPTPADAPRDAALLAILADVAPRISSLAALRLGEELRVLPDDSVWLYLPPSAVKTRRSLDLPLNRRAAPIVLDYLREGRPVLSCADRSLQLWLGTKGRPLNTRSLTKIVLRRTEEWFGTAEGPHAFRRWLRRAAARCSPEAAFDAAEVLGHSPSTSVRHYDQAHALHAGRRHAAHIARLRSEARRGIGAMHEDDQ